MFGCAGSLLLLCFSLVAANRGCSLAVMLQLFIVVASAVGERGLWLMELQELQHMGSVVSVPRL